MSVDYRHRARKRFGQNFLVDELVIENIISLLRLAPGDCVVEIGPGQGALTGHLLQRAGSLCAVELDTDLTEMLRQKFSTTPAFSLYQGDALCFDFASLFKDRPLRIVGNLPYNISTPLLFHLLTFAPLIQDMHFMLQKEVVSRLAASPGGKDYGRLSIMAQYHCQVDPLLLVSPQAFNPIPKVDSAIVRLTPRPNRQVAHNPELLQLIVKTAFQQRRKTLRNALRQIPGNLDLGLLSVDLSLRPESLSVEDFVQLSNELGLQNE